MSKEKEKDKCEHPSTHLEQIRYGALPPHQYQITVCDDCGKKIEV